MLPIYFGRDINKYPVSIYPKYEWIRSSTLNILQSITSYYNKKRTYVKRPNMLVSILENMDIDITGTPEDNYDNLSASVHYLANNHGLINSSNLMDKPLNGNIIRDTDEYILVNEDINNDVFTYTEGFDYTTFSSLKCIYTTIDDVFLTHPYEYEYGTGLDYSIFTLDLIGLGMQYYYWVIDMIDKEEDTDPARFIYEIILTNVINTLFDNALAKRLMDMYYKRTLGLHTSLAPIRTTAINNYLNKLLIKTLNNLHKITGRSRIEKIMQNIPMIINNDFSYLVLLPDTLFNKRNLWAIWLARLEYTNFLLKVAGRSENKAIINYLDKNMSLYEHGKYFSFEDEKTRDRFEYLLNNLKQTIKEL